MFQPRTFKIPLYQGDYQQRIARANQAVVEAEKRAKDGRTPPRLMGEVSEVDRLKAEHNALVAEAESIGKTTVTIKALGRKKWNTLVKEHPPRDGNDSDVELGVNDETFGDALLAESITEVSDETPVTDLLEVISSAQFDLLYGSAFRLNRDGGPLPFALPIEPSPSGAETAS